MGSVRIFLLRGLTAVVATVLAVELALQAAAMLAPLVIHRGIGATSDDAVTIMCVGDSHTYGAPLPQEESYPYQLEERLHDTYRGVPFVVSNLGVPGANSAIVANRLEAQIAQMDPDLIMVWVGINNFWNVAETDSWDGAARWSLGRRLLMQSKTFRLVTVLRNTQTGVFNERPEIINWGQPQEEQYWMFGNERLEFGQAPERDANTGRWQQGLRLDLTDIAQAARSYGIPLAFLTYPIHLNEFAETNEVIKSIGVEENVPVILSPEALERAKQDKHTEDDLIVIAAGPHPKAILYGYIVDEMMPVVSELLRSNGVKLSGP